MDLSYGLLYTLYVLRHKGYKGKIVITFDNTDRTSKRLTETKGKAHARAHVKTESESFDIHLIDPL